MKNLLLTIVMLITISMKGQIMDCSELFISEYVEGTWNNKALEIYNPTSDTIDLSAYIIVRYSNGITATTPQNAVQLQGFIDPQDVHVGVIEKLDPNGAGQEAPVWDTLQAKADEFYCPDYNTSFAFYFNGNDALMLAKGSINDIDNAQIVDVFGKIGEDPVGGWTNVASTGFVSSGYSWTENHTLIRKSTTLVGDTDPLDLFNVGLEWDSIAVNNFDNLGSHQCDCPAATFVDEIHTTPHTLYPNPANRGEIVMVKSNVAIKNMILTNILGVRLSYDNAIKTDNLVRGIYILDIEFVNGKFAKNKLIIN